jgi:hypothetical protein
VTSIASAEIAVDTVETTSPDDNRFKVAYSISHYEDFPEHPIEMSYQTWNTTTTTGQIEADIFSAYMTAIASTPVGKKLANFRLIDADIKVTLVVQGAPYAQGKLIYYFDPTPTDPTKTFVTTGGNIKAPQKVRSLLVPHIEIDPSTSKTYEIILRCPTIWGIFCPALSYGSYNFGFIAFNTLGSGTAVEPSVAITTYVSLVKPKLFGLTYTSKKSVGASENTTSKFSSYLSKASDISNIVSKIPIPMISEGANLFSSVASGAAKFLEHFGFSKPRVLGPDSLYIMSSAPDLTCIDGEFGGRTLATRNNNSIGISPTDIPMQSYEDQMIDRLMSKSGLVYQTSVLTTITGGTNLFALPVMPTLIFPTDSPAYTKGYELTPLAFATAPFSYWSGSIEVDVEVIASVFHRATIMMAYAPNSTDSALSFANAVQTLKTWQHHVVGNGKLKFTIPWSQAPAFQTVVVPQNSSNSQPYQNGVLIFYLVNPVVTNGSTDPIWINVYYSSRDMKYAIPSTAITSQFSLSLTSVPTTTTKAVPNLDDSFYSKYFGEAPPTSLKELCSKMTNVAYVSVYATAVGFNKTSFSGVPPLHPAAVSTTTNNVVYVSNLLSYVASSYVGNKGSFNWTYYPSESFYNNNTYSTVPVIGNYYASLKLQTTPTSTTGTAGMGGNGYALTTATPEIQNQLSWVFPYYYPGAYRINFPPLSPINQQDEVQEIGAYSIYNSTVTLRSDLYASLGDDANWIFYRGTPVMIGPI